MIFRFKIMLSTQIIFLAIILPAESGWVKPPAIRGNVDYTFIFDEADMNVTDMHSFHAKYCGMIENFDIFREIMKLMISNKALVIDNSPDAKDKVCWHSIK